MILPALRACQRGVTLYELMVGLAIAATVSLGAVGMVEWVERSRTIAQVNALIADLNLARSEAIKRGHPIMLCTSRDGAVCTGGTTWSEGYIIFVDANESKAREDDEPLVRVQQRLGALRVEYRGFNSHSAIVYQSSGTAAHNGTFTICPRRDGPARAVAISATGRARTATRTAAQAATVCGAADHS